MKKVYVWFIISLVLLVGITLILKKADFTGDPIRSMSNLEEPLESIISVSYEFLECSVAPSFIDMSYHPDDINTGSVYGQEYSYSGFVYELPWEFELGGVNYTNVTVDLDLVLQLHKPGATIANTAYTDWHEWTIHAHANASHPGYTNPNFIEVTDKTANGTFIWLANTGFVAAPETNGSVVACNESDKVIFTWNGTSRGDYNDGNYDYYNEMQIVLYQNGNIRWNIKNYNVSNSFGDSASDNFTGISVHNGSYGEYTEVGSPDGFFVPSAGISYLYGTPSSVCGDNVTEGSEECDGETCCDTDCTFLNSSNVCRDSAGVCDTAESCTGSSASCPSDSFNSSSDVCRVAANDCDPEETCTGSSATCPSDVFEECSSTTSSIPIYTIPPTQLSEGYTKELAENWRFEFEVKGDSHSLKMSKVEADSVVVIVSSEPQEVALVIGEEKKVDVDGDDIYDLMIKLNSISTLRRASLTVTEISEPISTPTGEETTTEQELSTCEDAGGIVCSEEEVCEGEEQYLKDEVCCIGECEKPRSWTWIIVLSLVVLSLIVYIIFKKRR